MTLLDLAERLLNLADRCENATGPDVALDDDIARARAKWENRLVWSGLSRPYTASLDAAMALVPKGWAQFDVDATAPELGIDWTLHRRKREAKATAATPALALCAAALRARGETL